MKKFVVVLVLSIVNGAVGQVNLVLNPSFESYTSCPNDTNEYIGLANHWSNPTGGTPDYFNQCDTGAYSLGVPVNWLNFQYAKTGVAYAGICVYGINVREYIQDELSDTLIANHHYCVSFYVSNVRDSGGYMAAVNKMGLFFSRGPEYSTTTGNLHFTPQIVSPDSVFLSDTLNWMEISGIYIASGGEKNIIIGNFNDDAHTDTLDYWNYGAGAYYYVDDVSVVDCTDAGIQELSIDNEITLYPNPATTALHIESTKWQVQSISIYNVLGEMVISHSALANSQSTINISQLTNGIYFVEVQTERGVVRKKFVKESAH